MKKIKCWNCKGTGTADYDNGYYHDTIKCFNCAGLGFLIEMRVKGELYRFRGEYVGD
jgi:hypothetical protein